jgi:signal peptidase II
MVTQAAGSFSAFVGRHRLVWLLLIALIGVAADQGTKMWAQQTLAKKYESSEVKTVDGVEQTITVSRFFPIREVVVIPNTFDLIYKENPAAAFSITGSLPDWFRKPFLLLVSSLATLFFLIWYFRLKEADALLMTSFCFIMAGAVGNLIDRATLGYVIDFLDFYAGFAGYPNLHWPTFNIADSCIVIGAAGVVTRTLKPLPAAEAKAKV